jgi:hypothetical protein
MRWVALVECMGTMKNLHILVLNSKGTGSFEDLGINEG